MSSRIRKLVAVAAVVFAATGAQAASQTLDGVGFDITYNDDFIGLFGTPTLEANSLVFAPSGSPGFSAQSDGGIKLTNSTFAFQITADPGYVLTSFTLFEEGDYLYFGENAGVVVSGQLRVKPLDPFGTSMTAAITADTSSPNVFFDFATQNWNSTTELATGNLGKANVSIENLLIAYAEPGFAFIEKKGVELAVSVVAVPEPESYALMLAGLGMIGVAARRRMSRRQ